jgi:tetratricopeptide (TPR) repeat protein
VSRCALPFAARLAALVRLLLLTAGLAGCAPSAPVAEQPHSDQRLERTNQVARVAFQHGQYVQALSLYRQAVDLAYERDDVDAVVDAQYNAAVCLLRLDRVDEADRLLKRTKAELRRARKAPPPEIGLLEVTILYHLQRYQEGLALAAQIIAAAPQSATARRARFLSGLMLAEQGDKARLQAVLLELDASDDQRLEADRLELSGHLALLEQRYDESVADFVKVAQLRSAGTDYRGTVRALTKAGEASEASGSPSTAAVHYLRAGRSALQQGDRDRARALLMRAHTLAELSGDSATAREAQMHLTELQESEPEPAAGG